MNNSFSGLNTNYLDESKRNYIPCNLAGQQVIVTQDQQRQIFDKLATYVNPNQHQQIVQQPPQYYYNNNNYSQTPPQQEQRQYGCPCPSNFPIRAEKHPFPGGVTFSFNNTQQLPSNRRPDSFSPEFHSTFGFVPNQPEQHNAQYMNNNNNAWQPTNLEQQLYLSYLQKQGFDALKYQRYSQMNPFQFQFHYDQATSTGDPFQMTGKKDCSCSTTLCNEYMTMEQDQDMDMISQIPFTNNNCSKQLRFPPPPSHYVSGEARKLKIRTPTDNTFKDREIFEDLEENPGKNGQSSPRLETNVEEGTSTNCECSKKKVSFENNKIIDNGNNNQNGSKQSQTNYDECSCTEGQTKDDLEKSSREPKSSERNKKESKFCRKSRKKRRRILSDDDRKETRKTKSKSKSKERNQRDGQSKMSSSSEESDTSDSLDDTDVNQQ